MSVKDRIERMSLRSQISTLTVFALALSLFVMGWVSYSKSSQLVRDLTLERLAKNTSDATTRIETSLDRARVYAATTPDFPPIPGLVRCWDNDGSDPEDEGSTTRKWLDRLSTILQAQMRANPEQAYSAVIDESGLEVLRLERIGERIIRIDVEADISAEKYFSEAMMQIVDGSVYISPMMQQEQLLVLHIAKPFFADPPGPARGVFVIGLDGQKLLEGASQPIKDGWLDIVDENGMFLFSTDTVNPVTPFSGARYEQFKPVRGRLLKNSDRQYDRYAGYISAAARPDGVSLFAAYQKVYYAGDADRSRFWAIAPSILADQALGTVNDLAMRFFLLGLLVLFVGGVITSLAAGGLTSALRQLAKSADNIAGGDLDTKLPEVRRFGEVDTLYQSFAAMTSNLRNTIETVRAEQRKTEAIFQATADALITIDEHGIVQAFNSTAEQMFGYRAQEVIGFNVSRLAPSPYREEHDSYLERYHRTGQARIIGSERELTAIRKDGSVFPMSLRVSEIIQDGRRTYIGTIQDITTRKTVAEERRRLFAAIRDAVKRLSTACQEITSTTAQQAAGSQQQATAITETVATVEQISQTAEQAAERANIVAQSARQAEEVGKNGQQAVQNSVAAMGQVKNEVESIAQSILALAGRAQAIGDIIATVSDIAEQTNVLALNAAVEASRAGEHGKGFSVVAGEVKSLAEQSKKATAQVRQILGEIQQAMNRSVLSTEQGTKSTIAAEEVVNQAGETIRSLTETLTQSVRLAMQISASANQQATGLVQLNHGIKNIDNVAKQNVSAINQIEEAATRLSGLSHELASLTSHDQAAS